jgi:hypothetical protein
VELSSHLLRGFRNIGCFIIWLCSQNHFLNVLPCQIFSVETFIIFFLGLVELQEQYSNEEIEEEETTDEDENDVIPIGVPIVFSLWSFFVIGHVNSLIHDIWPSF